jgi:hypothetical protein
VATDNSSGPLDKPDIERVVFNLRKFAVTAFRARRRLCRPRMSLNVTITITALERSLDDGKGLARDTRVRWAREEIGRP